jgi:amino acid transporter
VELKAAQQLAASLFFETVFGSKASTKALNFLIALSAYDNLTSSIIGSSRIIRECGRQRVLPHLDVWALTKPFGTPLASYILKWSRTVLMILGPPAGDVFNFVVDLQSYPTNVFYFATTLGLLLIRRRRKRLGFVRGEFRTWDVAIYFSLVVNVFILAMPWYPSLGERFGGDVSFWYATYCVVGVAL